jgi:DNA-binding XRE family transcriptional regulator/quercetin dioxygenase-like cupin family protein
MAVNEILARNVRRFREERQLSIGELGRRAGVAKQTVSSIEGGEGNPTVDTVERVAAALAVSVRALMTEMGVDVLVRPAQDADWEPVGTMDVRVLGQVYGSGYVTSVELRLDTANGVSQHEPTGHGSLRHCFVLEGTVSLGPSGSVVRASVGDFVRFPAEVPHQFEALGGRARVLVVTTAPQLTMSAGDSRF